MCDQRILVVDDSTDVCETLATRILGPAGYTVSTAADGAEGIQLARELRPDLLILDHELPHLTGLDVLHALREDGILTPAILITAESSENLAVRALRAGCCDYLTKPLDGADVLRAVERALNVRRAAVQPEAPLWNGQHPLALEATRSLEQYLREMDAFGKLIQSLTAQLDLEHLLNEVVAAAVTVTNAEEGSLLLVDEASGELYMRAAKNFDDDMAHTFRLQVSDSLAGEVMRSRVPMTLSSANAHKIATSYMVRDLIYAPLVMDGRAIGVLGVDNRVENRSFDNHHVRLLCALADYAVIAIRNASLYTRAQHERDTLDAILSRTEDVVIVTDPDGAVLIFNSTARLAFGVDGTDVTGRPLAEVVDHEAVLELFTRETLAGRALSGEVELSTGQTLHAQVTLIEGVGRVAVMQDITHLKELDRVRSDFVTTVSHDLRSPLTAILGYVELMGRAGELNDQQHKFVERIIYSVQSITALISDLLEIGRIETGLGVDKEPTPIRVIVQYAVESQRNLLEAHGHTLKVDLPSELPDVLGNPLRLKQLFVQLLDNAIRYTPEGGMVGVRAQIANDLVIVQVWDTGIGIPAQEQHRVFEKFYRAQNVIDTFAGTGLGLSIVKTIVEQHGGRVWVESKEGAGSTFTVMLPAYTAAAHRLFLTVASERR